MLRSSSDVTHQCSRTKTKLGNSVMITRRRTHRAKFFALVAFVGPWLGALVLLAQDGCFDNGGALFGSGFACAQADGSVVSLLGFIRLVPTVLVGVLVALTVVLVVRLLGRRIGGCK